MKSGRGTERGSLHAVIIAVLFVSLMATLGVVFYQNFIAKKEVVVEQPKTEESKPLVARVAYNSEIYSLDYPKEWKSFTDTDEPGLVGITSPDKDVKVSFAVSGGGIGGSCDPNDGLKISYYEVGDEPVKDLVDVPLYMVESISDSKGGGYKYAIGLTPDSGATHTAVGETHCNLGYVGVASLAVAENNIVTQPMIVAKILFPKLQPKDDAGIKDMQQIKDVINSNDYKTAVKILKSARKE